MATALRAAHPKKPTTAHRGTQKAKGATFQQLTRGLGTGMKAHGTESTYPFVGPDAALWARKTGNLDAQARSWVVRALRDPYVRSRLTGNTGTVPELVVVGRYLSLGYQMHRQVFFQETKLIGFRLDRVFVADVAILAPGGTLILLPIDGRYFHSRTLKQQLDGQRRNAALARLGKVVPIPDSECVSGARLNGFLRRNNVP